MKKQYNKSALEKLREDYIHALSESENSSYLAQKLADDLFALDLTVYSRNYSFESLVYNSFARSILDDGISLHPEQIRIIKHIEDYPATIISAPTSFGKTFCIFEYIAKHSPQNIVLVVPTLALVEEYLRKIIKKHKNFFSKYKVFTGINEDDKYDFSKFNLFILTHDRIINESAYSKLDSIDFLVIDEVYKLETDFQNDRVLVLNMAYYYLARKAKKYTLLAPFIGGVLNSEQLDKKPVFLNSTFSPVVNDVVTREILLEKERFSKCKSILNELNSNEKTLIYFSTVKSLYNYITDVVSKEETSELPTNVSSFIAWAKEEIHEDWCVITALEHGYVLHNGQIPLGTRMFQLDLYEKLDCFNKMLCTSTLLEGVNTSAKNIIITKPSRKSDTEGESFAAFDFFNLVGRTGRLNKYFVGNAYYIKSPSDPDYIKSDAIKEIKFEITDESKDIDIQKGEIREHKEIKDFLTKLRITLDDYLKNIGSKLRFDTVVKLHSSYENNKQNLISELTNLLETPRGGLRHLVEVLYLICEGKTNSLKISLITQFLHKSRPKIRTVVDNVREYYKKYDINSLIAAAIKIKNNYIEHDFYVKVSLIQYFMELDNSSETLLSILNKKILNAIEFLYFINSKHKKMLYDLGIYEHDIDYILKIIDTQFEDVFELKELLRDNVKKFKKIGYLSRYIIENLD